MRCARALIPMLLLLASPASSSAQESCFRGRPPVVCRSFWITDAAGGIQGIGGRSHPYLAAELGWMRSVGDHAAVGLGVVGGHAIDDIFVSLRPRYRRWLTHTTALDAAVGVRWAPGRVEQAEALVGINWRDLGGVWAGIVADLGAQQIGWMAGAKTSSYAGVATWVLGTVIGAVYVIALLPTD